jgi:hypothetical protein
MKLGWTERGGAHPSNGDPMEFSIGGLEVEVRIAGQSERSWARLGPPARWSGGIARWDADDCRGVIETRGNDSRDDRCGEIFGLIVCLRPCLQHEQVRISLDGVRFADRSAVRSLVSADNIVGPGVGRSIKSMRRAR